MRHNEKYGLENFADDEQIIRSSLLPTRGATAYDVILLKGLGWYNFEADDVTNQYDADIEDTKALIDNLNAAFNSLNDKYKKIIECRECDKWRCRKDCGEKNDLGIGTVGLEKKLDVLFAIYKTQVNATLAAISNAKAKLVTLEKDKADYISKLSKARTDAEKAELQTQERKKMASEKVGVQIKNWGLIAIGAIAIIFLIRQIIKT